MALTRTDGLNGIGEPPSPQADVLRRLMDDAEDAGTFSRIGSVADGITATATITDDLGGRFVITCTPAPQTRGASALARAGEHAFTHNPAGVTVMHAPIGTDPLCGWIADGETVTGEFAEITCRDCLAALGADLEHV